MTIDMPPPSVAKQRQQAQCEARVVDGWFDIYDVAADFQRYMDLIHQPDLSDDQRHELSLIERTIQPFLVGLQKDIVNLMKTYLTSPDGNEQVGTIMGNAHSVVRHFQYDKTQLRQHYTRQIEMVLDKLTDMATSTHRDSLENERVLTRKLRAIRDAQRSYT